jgi:hypothetical protein
LNLGLIPPPVPTGKIRAESWTYIGKGVSGEEALGQHLLLALVEERERVLGLGLSGRLGIGFAGLRRHRDVVF